MHAVPKPTMGGLAMYAGFLVGMSVAFLMPFFADMRRGTPIPLAAVVTCTLMFGLGRSTTVEARAPSRSSRRRCSSPACSC